MLWSFPFLFSVPSLQVLSQSLTLTLPWQSYFYVLSFPWDASWPSLFTSRYHVGFIFSLRKARMKSGLLLEKSETSENHRLSFPGYILFVDVIIVQSLLFLSVTPWTAACQAFLSFTISWSLLRLMSTESVMPSNHLILCHLLSFCLSLSQHQGLFQEVDSLIRWPKCWSFSFSIGPSNEHSGLISFRIDWSDLVCCCCCWSGLNILKYKWLYFESELIWKGMG